MGRGYGVVGGGCPGDGPVDHEVEAGEEEDRDESHHDEVKYKHHIFRVQRVQSQSRPIVDWIKDYSRYVCPILGNDPLLVPNRECLYLEKLGDIVEDGEEHNRDDVAKSVTHLIKRGK